MAKPKNIKKVILIAVIVVVLLILICVGAVVTYVVSQYNRSYEHVDIVKRQEVYVMPEYPVLDETPPEEGEDDGTDFIEPDIIPPEVAEEQGEADESKETAADDTAKNNTSASTGNTGSSKKSGKILSAYKKVSIFEEEQKDKEILNILLLGTDSRDLDSDMGRSDTMVVISYNANAGTVKMTSILRDSLVPIEGYGWNKINTAFFFGGVGLAINTVNQLFDLDIQKFAVVDIRSVRNFIKRIGGIDVNLTQAEVNFYNQRYDRDLKPGINHLDATLTMAHLQNRSVDSDFGRTRRQRDVIEAVVNKILKEKTLKEINRLVKYGTEIIRTNIDLTEMLSLASSVVENKDVLSIESQSVPYANSYKSTWYKRKAVLSFDIEDAAKRINEFIYSK